MVYSDPRHGSTGETMSARHFLLSFVAGLSSVAAKFIRVMEGAAGPLVRLWRLSHLKARVGGRVPVTTQFDGTVESSGRLRLELGEHCRIGRRVFLETCEAGVIRVGDNVRINSGTFIVAYSQVSIGRDALIGEYVSIRDADHGMALGIPMREQPHSASPIFIGEGAWIGRGAVVLKGVTIGAGAVVAANSVVTRDVRPLAIVGGVPAREIRRRDPTPTAPEAADSPSARSSN